jgi:hypothetical protein
MSYPAVVLTNEKGATLQANPQSPFPPAPGADEVLIKNVAVASNPKVTSFEVSDVLDRSHVVCLATRVLELGWFHDLRVPAMNRPLYVVGLETLQIQILRRHRRQ